TAPRQGPARPLAPAECQLAKVAEAAADLRQILSPQGGVATCPSIGPKIPQKQYIIESVHAVKDLDGQIAEYREALRLNPNNDVLHANLGNALGKKGDWDGQVAEEREALRLNPNNADAHYNLGVALENKGDRDGAMAEERE